MARAHDRQKVAVLIDAENTSPRIADALFARITLLGDASVRRAYGDFSGTRLKSWSEASAAHAIIPQQNFAGSSGKNASDIALVIDAMDLLHTGRFDAFCLVSSDSDFTRLAERIREQGVDVYGFGEAKTPDSFRKACKEFIDVAGLAPVAVPGASRNAASHEVIVEPDSAKQQPSAALIHIRTAIGRLGATNGWYCLGAIGTQLAMLVPGFDSRTYGCEKLKTLIEETDAFEIKHKGLTVHIRAKRQDGDMSLN